MPERYSFSQAGMLLNNKTGRWITYSDHVEEIAAYQKRADHWRTVHAEYRKKHSPGQAAYEKSFEIRRMRGKVAALEFELSAAKDEIKALRKELRDAKSDS